MSLRALSLAALFAVAQAHGNVIKIAVGGQEFPGYQPDFQYKDTAPIVAGWTAPQTQDNGFVPISSINDPDVICHKGATPGQGSIKVAAGDKVTLEWSTWPESHKGPMLDYLADCGGDCSKVTKTDLKFFKIDGVGLADLDNTTPEDGLQLYGDDIMRKNKNKWTVTIPPSIKAGNYVLRHETIALHEGQKVGGAQLYPQCVNLEITGGGSDTPVGVPGTQLYKADEPGIVFDIYKQFKSLSDYPVPGPALYSGAVNGGANNGGAVTTTAATAATAATSGAPKSNTVSGSTGSTSASTSSTKSSSSTKASSSDDADDSEDGGDDGDDELEVDDSEEKPKSSGKWKGHKGKSRKFASSKSFDSSKSKAAADEECKDKKKARRHARAFKV